jgi:hypothetical protein
VELSKDDGEMRGKARKLTSLATALIVLAMLVVALLPQPAQANPDPWWNTD